MPKWVKVEFYGQAPDDWEPLALDMLQVGGQVMEAFGFTHADSFAITDPACRGGPVDRQSPADPPHHSPSTGD